LKRHCRKIGLLVILLGVCVILALVLPAGFWILLTGVLLILAGISILKR